MSRIEPFENAKTPVEKFFLGLAGFGLALLIGTMLFVAFGFQ
jgi:hypothetical protein